MAGESSIEWTDATWNPVRGCVKVSPGCKNCYAETFAERWRGVKGNAYEQGFDPRLVPEALDWPLRRRKPSRIFVNSMSDLHGDFVPFEYVAAVYGVMAATKRHTYQVLTKRPERRLEWHAWLNQESSSFVDRTDASAQAEFCSHRAWLNGDVLIGEPVERPWPLPNVWEGVSVEDRKYGVPRIAVLRDTPAAVRFLSVEPLLEDVGTLDLCGIDWVIVGAESGRRARPMNEDWVRSIRDQCFEQDVRFFYKQRLDERGKTVSLPVLDGQRWAQFPAADGGKSDGE